MFDPCKGPHSPTKKISVAVVIVMFCYLALLTGPLAGEGGWVGGGVRSRTNANIVGEKKG